MAAGDDTTLSTRTWGADRLKAAVPDLPTHAGRDRYVLLGPLGRGGMGEVLRVRDQRLETDLAMKVLSAELTHSDRAQARFRHEVTITAQLRHPGIVSVHDRGELDDGRPWFTMTEVRGRTLAEVLAEHHSEPRPGSLRTLVDLVRRAAEAVAYAHSEGVIHRDLKPSNVMVGEFGELFVMDWGLARRLDSPDEDGPLPELSAHASATRTGDIIGTPGFMAPEQARGESATLGPEADVYALGSVLYNALSGRRPYQGSAYQVMAALLAGPPPALEGEKALNQTLPGELVEACGRAMAREPGDRFPDASGLVRALTDWLDGARRIEEAHRAVQRAQRIRPEIEDLRSRARALQESADTLLATIKPNDPIPKKRTAWALMDQADSLLNAAAIQEATWLQTVRSALNQVPDFAPADAMLATHYRDTLLAAERTGAKVDAARAEALLRAHDHGEHAALLEGRAWLTLHTEPRGARATLYTWVERDRRLELQFTRDLGPTPLKEAPVSHGSHVVRLEHPDCEPVDYPILVGRLDHWDGVPPGAQQPAAVPLPPRGSLAPGEVYVPAGWMVGGGDPDALDSIHRVRCWVPGFSIRREPVTWAEYLRFLDHLAETGGRERAEPHVPRTGQRADQEDNVRWGPSGYELGLSVDGDHYLPDCAAELISWRDALAYCAWEAERTGRPWGLPNGLAWEKAARGVDGRPYPWGHHFDATYANLATHFDPPRAVPTDQIPSDRSPYGVLGMAGGSRDWCCNLWRHEGPRVDAHILQRDHATDDDPDYREIRGGNYHSTPGAARAAARWAGFPDQRVSGLGFRLFRWLDVDDAGRIVW